VVERRHRWRAGVEDRIHNDKDTGPAKSPFKEFALNEAWLRVVALAHDLIVRTRLCGSTVRFSVLGTRSSLVSHQASGSEWTRRGAVEDHCGVSPGERLDGGLRTILPAAGGTAALAVYFYVAGWGLDVTRFAAARLPAVPTADQSSVGDLLARGVFATLAMAAVVAAGCVLALLSSARRWDVHGQDWHDIVAKGGVAAAAASSGADVERRRRRRQHARKVAGRAGGVESWLRGKRLGGVARVPGALQKSAGRRADSLPDEGRPQPLRSAPLGDTAVRLVAGFNIMVLSGLIALALDRFVQSLVTAAPWTPVARWAGVVVGVGVFLALRWLLTLGTRLILIPWLHGLVWGVVALAALFASAPLGVLVLTGVGIATLGRRLARMPRPSTPRELARSPLPWVLLGVCLLVGLADSAMPPVSFPTVTVSRSAGELTGGYVSRDGRGVYMVTCTALADATSTNERLQFVPAGEVTGVRLTGQSDYLDSGDRPSIARLTLHALGLGADPPTLVIAALRERRSTCAGAGPSRLSAGFEDPALGSGVIAGPAPTGNRAHDGETPIQDDRATPAATAALALRYQPTVLVSVADRNWPVPVGAVLAERGPDRTPVCLIESDRRTCSPGAQDLTTSGAKSDYLQLPVTLGRDRSPLGQFQAFLAGQYQSPGPLDQWLADPGRLDPWYSAQLYFYEARGVDSGRWPQRTRDPNVPSGLIALEYWFYYPFNYYPLVTDSGLMDEAPLAGDRANVDLHQGDWEHVDVLLEPATHKPVWLYLARHADEGAFVPWTSPTMRFDAGHPIVQAAFGGHPSYLPGCGARPRAITHDASSDWLSCGSGRFAFRAASTPLVNLGRMPWACWPGHFGEASSGPEVDHAKKSESVIDSVKHFIYVAGPVSPLRQSENDHDACRGLP
jgi:hypothetical protein